MRCRYAKTYWEANLVPGTLIASDALKFKRNGGEVTFSLDRDVTLEAGKLSLITIPVHDNSDKYVCLNLLTAERTISEKSILSGQTNQKIKIADGTDITLCGAIINNQIKCEGDATIYLLSENVVTCSSKKFAGIEAGPADKTLKIDGSGKLTVTGGQDGAGIGSGYWYSTCGAITINGVKGMRVNSGANNSACIGKGNNSRNVGEIKVTDSTIILDNSGGTNAPYFNPSPTVNSGNTFYDKDGNVITL